MRRVRRGVALGAVLALGFGLSACGGDDNSSDTGGSLTIWADENQAPAFQSIADSWGSENGVDVTITQINFDDMKDQFAQQAPAGQGPDILIGASDWLGGYVPSGLVAPVDLGDNAGNFNQAAVDAFNFDGQNYGVPIATENIILFRNTDLAPNAPTSIEDMAKTGLALQAEGKTQYPIGLQQGEKGDAYHAYPFFSAAGGYFFAGPNGDGAYDVNDVGVASEGGLLFGQKWAGLGKEGALKSTFIDGDLQAAWAAGTLPYWITGPWNSQKVKDSGVPYEVEPIPGWEGVDEQVKPIVGVRGMMLNQNSQNATTAQAFLDATMNTEFMNSLFQADPRPPAWTESAEAASSDPIIKAVLEFGDGGYPSLPYPEMGIAYEEVGLAQKRILDGANPDTEMKAAQDNIIARTGAAQSSSS